MDKFMIVNATQLDADLALIADKIKEKLNETGEYNFPEDFLTAIDKMVYDENPNTVDNIINNEDGTITIPAGYYSEDIVFTLPIEEEPGEENPDEEPEVDETPEGEEELI